MINEINLPNAIGNSYKHAYPFPYILIDNFIDEYMADCSRQELKGFNHWETDLNAYVINEQVNKEYELL